MAATTTTITPTSAPAIAPAGDSFTGDLSEPGVGRRDNADVEVTGGGLPPGLGSGVGTRRSLLLLTAVSVPETKIRTELVSVRDKDRGTQVTAWMLVSAESLALVLPGAIAHITDISREIRDKYGDNWMQDT